MKSKITTKKKNKRPARFALPARIASQCEAGGRSKAGGSKQSNKRVEIKIKGIKKTLSPPPLNSEGFKRGEKIKNMTTKEILEKVKKELADLTGFKSPSAIGFKKEGNDLIATIEVIEKESIPDGMDVLGTYEVRVDQDGKILGYERTDLRKRVDTALNREA